jgi:hypothetical protein
MLVELMLRDHSRHLELGKIQILGVDVDGETDFGDGVDSKLPPHDSTAKSTQSPQTHQNL